MSDVTPEQAQRHLGTIDPSSVPLATWQKAACL